MKAFALYIELTMITTIFALVIHQGFSLPLFVTLLLLSPTRYNIYFKSFYYSTWCERVWVWLRWKYFHIRFHHNHYQRYHFQHLLCSHFQEFFPFYYSLSLKKIKQLITAQIFSSSSYSFFRNVFQLHNVHGCVFCSFNDFNLKLSSS